MPKPVARMWSGDINSLRDLPEAGMGYYAVSGRLEDDPYDRPLVIYGDFVLPIRAHDQFFSLSDLFEGEVFPSEEARGLFVRMLTRSAAPVVLPPGYLPSPGAIPLLGTITLASSVTFYRHLSRPSDHRYANGLLAKDTYLTTELDRQYANTGFATVGRYALPIPVPAKHVIAYDLPAQTVLAIGTVLPNYGQAGGGVEVKTTGDIAATQTVLPDLPEY